MNKWLNENAKGLFRNHNGVIGVMATMFGISNKEATAAAQSWLEDNFYYEGDYITQQTCESCDWEGDGPEEEIECPECEGTDLMNYTGHEDSDCNFCGRHIDMWNDAYVNHDIDGFYCVGCIEEVEHILDSIEI